MGEPGDRASTPPGNARRLDRAAVAAGLRRLRRAGSAPWLHQEIARRLVDRLDGVHVEASRVVDWWAGASGAEAAIVARWPKAKLVAVEADRAWIEQRRASRPSRWSRLLGARDVESVLDDGTAADAPAADADAPPADLVVANLALHAALDPPATIARWHALLAPGGVLAFSAFGPGTLAPLRTLFAARGWPSPAAPFVDMHDFGDMLTAAGFAEPVLDQETITLTWPSAAAALDELHGLGGNADPSRFAGLRTPRWRAELVAALEATAGADGRVALPFEVAYGHGFRAERRPAPGEPVTVPLERLRASLGKRPPGR